MGELRQPYTPIGIANETLDETIIVNENRQEADHHSITHAGHDQKKQSSDNNGNDYVRIGFVAR